MWATRRLSADHKTFLKLLDRMEDLAAVPGLHARSRLREALTQFCEIFEPHERFEEEVLFPALEPAPASRTAAPAPGTVLALEHREIRRLIAEVDAELNAADADHGLAGSVARFAERVRRHAENEDTVAYPLAEMRLGAAQLESMTLEMDRRARAHRPARQWINREAQV